jgi:hypothetical protein
MAQVFSSRWLVDSAVSVMSIAPDQTNGGCTGMVGGLRIGEVTDEVLTSSAMNSTEHQ